MKDSAPAAKRHRRRRSPSPLQLLWKKLRLMFQPKWVREYEKFKDK